MRRDSLMPGESRHCKGLLPGMEIDQEADLRERVARLEAENSTLRDQLEAHPLRRPG